MRKLWLFAAAAIFGCLSLLLTPCSAQSGPNPPTDAGAAGAPPAAESTPATAQGGTMAIGSKVGVAVKMSLLGIGAEVATPLTYHTNIRAGFNAFSYSRGFNNDGINYNASLSFRSAEAHFDWFPFAGGFHLSPGLMIYNGNQITANASVPGLNSFTLGGTTYTSNPADPITGSGKIGFNKVGPMLTAGWGNLVPRSDKHIVVPFEFGVLFQGSPQATLNLAGSACDSTGANCQNVATDTTFQNNVIAQQNKLNNNMSFFKVYPIISLGFGYKF